MAPNRLVVLLTPLVAAAAAFLTGKVAQWTGVTLDKDLLAALMLGELAVVFGVAREWLIGWRAHEMRVDHAKHIPGGRRHSDAW